MRVFWNGNHRSGYGDHGQAALHDIGLGQARMTGGEGEAISFTVFTSEKKFCIYIAE